ncbi:MAG: GerW family sporulation protein [Clostridia bacterium]|nr:GerW family sporulation protein [Clostridia bacterium]
MGQHPIEELMKTAMESIKEMVDVNTIVGDAVQTIDGTVIIPVSRVAFGFAAGGGEYSNDRRTESATYPFAGGSGAGVSINPVAFMVVGRNNTIKMISASPQASLDRILDNVPEIIEKVKKAFDSHGKCDSKRDDKEIIEKVTEKETLKYQDPEHQE